MARDAADDDRRTPKLRRGERSVEERLRRISDAGELSGLPGEGKPLDLSGAEHAGDRWAAFRPRG